MATVIEKDYQCGEISGTLWDVGGNVLCIIAHGLSGHSETRLGRNYSKNLTKKGVNSLRINLHNIGNRKLSIAGFNEHIQDINAVIIDCKENYKHICYIGHSVGGMLGFLIDETLLSGIIGRDATLIGESGLREEVVPGINDLTWIMPGDVDEVISKKYVEEIYAVSDDYMKDTGIPYCVICAEKVGFFDTWKQYHHPSKKHYAEVIEGCGHMFSERGAEEKLFELSNKFLDEVLESM